MDVHDGSGKVEFLKQGRHASLNIDYPSMPAEQGQSAAQEVENVSVANEAVECISLISAEAGFLQKCERVSLGLRVAHTIAQEVVRVW